MTGRDLISASARLIGVLASGETLQAAEASDGLAALNRLIDSWSNENLLIHALTEEAAFTLTPGDGTVTMGTAGDITTRPVHLEAAKIRDTSSSIALEVPLKILSPAEWVAIPTKSMQSSYPTSIYDDGAYPQRTLSLYPVPSIAHQLILFTKRALTELTSLDTAVSLPPGYDRALVYNFAIELAPEYGKSAPAEVVEIALQSKAALKRQNHRASYLRCDDALVRNGKFNMFSGETT
jgi:hypothetical protein